MAEFREIPIKSIIPDPNQPRRFYDEAALQELTASIEQKGVLQPILVRPWACDTPEQSYQIVCGERRFRAAKAAGLKEIPATIRDITDEEALEMQIIENLQRKDVHPMEEAVAFRSLIDNKQKDIREIAAIVGKSPTFVAQRLKLNDLIEEIQQVFFQGRMSLTDAITLCKFNAEDQKDYYEREIDCYDGHIEVNEYDLRRYSNNLIDPPFDTEDPGLNPLFGKCSSCQHNSASLTLLFPDAENKPMCLNSACFRQKCDAGFEKRLAEAIEDPAIVLISMEWSEGKETKELRKKVAGILGYNEYDRISQDDVPERSDFTGNNDTEEEDEEAYQEALEDYRKDQAELQDRLLKGEIHKAFVVDGGYRGTYRYVKLKKGVAQKSTADPGERSSQDIDAEIYRIREKEKRSKELDDNKIWDQLKTHFRPEPNLQVLKGPLSQAERKALVQALYNKLGYEGRGEFKKFFKLQSGKGMASTPVWPEITDDLLQQMQRFFFLKELPPAVITNGYDDNAKACLAVAEQYFPGVLKDIQDKQQELATKRAERAEKRIKELQDLKKSKFKPAKKAKA